MGEASESDPRCGIYIMFTGIGTLLVDDVSLMPGIREDPIVESGWPPQKGNRIYNSGFEAGPEGWTPVGGFALDDKEAHSGRSSARLEAAELESVTAPINRPLPPNYKPRIAPPGIECRPFPVRTGQRYTLTAWIKAAASNTRVHLRFFEWADQGSDSPENRDERACAITTTTEWARYQFSGIVLPNFWESYVVRIVPSSTIWLDDVQVEEGDATDYQPAQSLEVGAETPTRSCRVGERVQVTARVASGHPGDAVVLKYTLEDLWSRPVTTVEHRLKSGAPDRADFTLKQPGMYRVRVRADDSPAAGEVWFGVFPERDRWLRPDSPFGTHVTSTVPEPSNTMLASAKMGARWVRLHDFGDFCHWRVVEPEKGQFVWCDAEIDELRKRGFLILANLGHPPLWAGRDSDPSKNKNHGSWTPSPPRDIGEWENYILRTVEHYRGRIRHWEVWNEPNWKAFFAGTPEEYTELLKVAFRAIKRADPQAVILGGCFAPSDEPWTERVLGAGGLDFMDVLSYHVYWSPPLTLPTTPGEAPNITQQVQRFVELMRKHGEVKPIYMTEGGIRCPPFASWLPKEGFERSAPFGSQAGAGAALTGVDAAAGLVRGMVEMLSAGVQQIDYYYSGGLTGAMPWFSTMANGSYVLMDYDGRPKPTMMAYSAMESFLGDAKSVKALRREDLWIHLFTRGKGAVAVVWSDRARPLPPPAGVAVFDLMGNEMKTPALAAGEPVYVVGPKWKPDQLQALIR
jgi:hypothetical protein